MSAHAPTQAARTNNSPANAGILQRRAVHAGGPNIAPPIVHEVLQSPGHPLNPMTRTLMESRFSHDFSRIRVHTDARAAESAQAVNALAYTVGQDIVFDNGNYNPSTSAGLGLLTHELVHALQQPPSLRPNRKNLEIASENTQQEQEAKKFVQIKAFGFQAPSFFTPALVQLQRACGAAEIGSVAGCIGRGGDVTDFGGGSEYLFRFAPSCDELLPGERDRVLELSERITPFHHAEIDGFASEEGSPDFNEELSCARAHAVASILLSTGPSSLRIDGLYKHGATPGPREDRRSAVVTLYREQRPIQQEEQNLLDRLERLTDAAVAEASGTQSVRIIWQAESFGQGVRGFKRTLKQRLESLQEGEALPDDLRFVMEALMLWSKDPGNQWGEGIWDSEDLVMSAADYATVPEGQYKCNAYVAEVAYHSFGIVQRVYESEEQPGRYFPHRAGDWGDANLAIPHFPVVTRPQMGDVWSNGSHTGIYLGTYAGHRLYISARDTGSGVWGLRSEIQKEHGIQIKELEAGGVYRRYTP